MPIDEVLPRIVAAVGRGANLVIQAPPGAGKTTRVPRALCALNCGKVVVLEPRRLAARMAARRAAAELGEAAGDTVGYQVRFEEAGSASTRLWYWTEGVLTRRLHSDPTLDGIGVVILDEFHERHLDTDLALALLRRLQLGPRPDLRIVVMSATMDPQPVAAYLGGAETIASAGRLHPLTIEYTPYSAAPLEQQVLAAFERLDEPGDILAFLPGAAEIRRAQRACEPSAGRRGIDVVPLYADLAPAEQDRAVTPGSRRKLILSTNVAESSITIEGVTAVIDSGLARVAADSPWTGIPSLNVTRISKASADQRAGRAGRVRPGKVIRLYPLDDFVRRAEREVPEMLRRELSRIVLDLHAMRAVDLDWFEPPPPQALEAAGALLAKLGAIDANGLTRAGRRMAPLAVHPRLGRMLVDAAQHGAGDSACRVAAMLGSGEQPADLLAAIDGEWQPATRRTYEQLRRGFRGRDERALLQAILRGFPDRVARRRSGDEYLLAGGSSCIASGSDFIVALDIEERRERGLPRVRVASPIEPEWLLDEARERSTLVWNRTALRVDRVSVIEYDGLIIDETREGGPLDDSTAELLGEKALEAGLERFAPEQELEAFLARVAFAASHSKLAALTKADAAEALRAACVGKRSFADLAGVDIIGELRRRVPELERIAPSRLKLARGREVRVNYEHGQAPWIASRLQDFFGMRESPSIAGVPVVIRLLAPSQRPVQTTSDLAGFWDRLYPQVRRELSRRYPKHAWPERPF